MQTELNTIIGILYLFIFAILLYICTKIPWENRSNKDHIYQAEAMREKLRVRQRVVPKSPTELELEQLSRTLREEWRKDEASKRSVKPIPGVSYAIRGVKESLVTDEEKVSARRGGEFVGNRMRFKVKVVNESQYMITDVLVYLLSYPKEALKFAGEDTDCQFPKIEPGGFRSPTFDFLPTQDCVKGEILAGVSYVDMKGKAHTLSTKPFVIKAVCDLLIPDQVSPEAFAQKLKLHEHGEIVIKVEEWTPEEMFEKALRILDESNFFEISSNLDLRDGVAFGNITGLAKGKYTGMSIAVEMSINGPIAKKGASCTIRVSGEDQAMILPAIDDLKERLNAWLCPMCSSPLTLQNVEDLKDGKVIQCPFCAVSIGR